MLRRILWIVAIVFAALVAPTVLRASTYDVNTIVGAGSTTGMVTGSIMTDGTIGVLASDDILSVDLFLTVPSTPTYNMTGDVVAYSTITGTPALDCGVTCGLTASATEITFNFSAPDGTYFNLQAIGTTNDWCLSSSIDCGVNPIGGGEDFVTVGDPTVSTLGLTGEVEIASAEGLPTPEPGTGGLLLIGVGLLGFMMVMRKRSARGLLQAS